MFKVRPLPVTDAFILQTDVFQDDRGKFEVFWEEPILASHDILFRPTNAHHSYNAKSDTLRGMHYQRLPHGQSKLVSCVSGKVWDVMVDLRPESPTFQQWHATRLTAASGTSVFVPAGCAHGFVTLEDHSTLAYLIEGDYVPDAGRVLKWNDKTVGIEWPVDNPAMSNKDATAPEWNQCEF